jgi:hypothetical protein
MRAESHRRYIACNDDVRMKAIFALCLFSCGKKTTAEKKVCRMIMVGMRGFLPEHESASAGRTSDTITLVFRGKECDYSALQGLAHCEAR